MLFQLKHLPEQDIRGFEYVRINPCRGCEGQFTKDDFAIGDIEINADKFKGRRQFPGVLKQLIVAFGFHKSVDLFLAERQAILAITKKLEVFIEKIIFRHAGFSADTQ